MKPFILTPLAARDLDEIWDYLAEDSIAAADRVLDALAQGFYKLTAHPGIGHIREDLAGKKYKFFLVYSYLIIYRPDTRPLEIIRVLHASRDIEALLDFT